MNCHSDQRQQIELADCVVGGACVLARGCALTVLGGSRRQGLAVHLLHTLVWNGKARRAGGGGSLTFPRIAPLEEAAWASLPRTTPHHAQGGPQHLWVQWRHRTGIRPVAPSPLGLHPLAPGKFPVCGDCSSQRGCRVLPPRAVDWEVVGLRLDTQSPP